MIDALLMSLAAAFRSILCFLTSVAFMLMKIISYFNDALSYAALIHWVIFHLFRKCEMLAVEVSRDDY